VRRERREVLNSEGIGRQAVEEAVRKRREPQCDSNPGACFLPLGTSKKDQRRCYRRCACKQYGMGDRAVRERPSEVVDVGQCGAGGSDEAHALRRRRSLRPGRDREADCRV